MHLLVLVVALLGLAAANPEAIPQTPEPTYYSSQSVAGVYECNQPGWKGGCWWTKTSGGLCHQWNPSGRGSFGPDQGIWCTFYADDACGAHSSEKADWFEWPGNADMGNSPKLKAAGIDRPNSYNCRWK